MPLHIIDTAGLRESPDEVEQIGIQRAWQEIEKADRILLMVDATETKSDDPEEIWPELVHQLPKQIPISIIRNKIDQSNETAELLTNHQNQTLIRLSAKEQQGINLLREHLKDSMGFQSTTEGGFIARRRHLDALDRAEMALEKGLDQLLMMGAGELLAEDLKDAQNHLSEITGEFTPDDLLGRIFSSFCIGK